MSVRSEWEAYRREAEADYFEAAEYVERLPPWTPNRAELVEIVRRLQSRWETRSVAFDAWLRATHPGEV